MAAHKGIGKERMFGVAKEAVRGTAETAATYYLPVLSMEVNEDDDRVVDEQADGVIEAATGETITSQWATHKITVPIDDKIFTLLMLNVLGSLSTGDNADSDASIKDHTLSVLQGSQHPALTFFLDDPLAAADYKYANGMIKDLEVKLEKRKYAVASFNAISKKGASATLTPAVTSNNLFLSKMATVKFAANLAGLAAASAVDIESLTLKFDPKVGEHEVLTGIADFLNGSFQPVSGSIELKWDAETYKTLSLAATPQAMRIDLLHTVTIGAAAKPEHVIDLARVIFKPVAVSGDLGGFVKQTLTFTGYYSRTDTSEVTLKSTNAVASY